MRRTEGWVTALRLAALSLRHRDWSDDLTVGIEGAAATSRSICWPKCCRTCQAGKQVWLLKASVLDRFCAPLLDAVCLTGLGKNSESWPT